MRSAYTANRKIKGLCITNVCVMMVRSVVAVWMAVGDEVNSERQ